MSAWNIDLAMYLQNLANGAAVISAQQQNAALGMLGVFGDRYPATSAHSAPPSVQVCHVCDTPRPMYMTECVACEMAGSRSSNVE